MQATAQIISKLRNARFQPPQGGPKEKLAWINDGEADLLRLHGGSGKKRKFGLPSFGKGDIGNSVGSAGASDGAGDGKGGQIHTNGTGMGQSNVLRQINGRWNVVSRADASRIDAGGSMRTAAPVAPVAQRVAPPVPIVKPPIRVAPPPMLVATPVPRMKPAVAVTPAPTIKPQNYGFVAPTMTPRTAAPAPNIQPQSYGFQAPTRTTAPMTKAPATRAQEIRTDRMAPMARVEAPRADRMAPMARMAPRTDRMPTGSFQPSSYRAPATRTDRAPMVPGAGVRAVPEGPRTDRMQSAPASITGMTAEAARRAAVNRMRTQHLAYRSPPGLAPQTDIKPQNYGFQAPALSVSSMVPTPRQNPLRDTTKIRTDGTFDAAKDFGLVEGPALSRLAALQDRYGKPITVTEGAALGHVAKSQHHINPLTGKANAMDLSVPTEDRATLARLANLVGFGGIGAYGSNLPNMVHVDIGKRRSWGPLGKAKNIGQLHDKALQAALRDRTIRAYAGMGDE